MLLGEEQPCSSMQQQWLQLHTASGWCLKPAIVLLQLEKERARLAKANKGDEASLNTIFTKMQHKQAKAEGVRRCIQQSLAI